MAPAKFHDLTISSIRPQTDKGTAICFDIPDDLKETFAFTPGQYLTLRATINGEDIRRSYSISSAVQDHHLEVGIKQVEGGAFSNYAATLSVGDTIAVMPPQGRFTAEIEGQHNYLLIAAGSGITPCLSIAKSILKGEPDSTISLVYGNSRTNTIMFREDIDALKDVYTSRLKLIHILSREKQDIEFLFGRIDQPMIEGLASRGLITPTSFDAAYLCGPQEMTEIATRTLEALGMKNIRTELFATTNQPPVKPRVHNNAPLEGSPVSITVDGTQNDITVDGTSETVLAAAQRAGLDLPFSCAGGMCCTCRCKVVSGKAEMDVNYSLQDWEVEAGFVLACQARPVSEDLALDFDAA